MAKVSSHKQEVSRVLDLHHDRALLSKEAGLPIMINRDLSLLEFFGRVLQESLNVSKPVLERLKFLAIFSANPDEFFMIRFSGLLEKLGLRADVSLDGYSRSELLDEIKRRVTELILIQMHCLRDELVPELARNGLFLLKYQDLSEKVKKAADQYFDDQVYPTLTPQAVDPTHPFPYISGGSIISPSSSAHDSTSASPARCSILQTNSLYVSRCRNSSTVSSRSRAAKTRSS